MVGVEGFEPPSLSAAALQAVELLVPDLLSTPILRAIDGHGNNGSSRTTTSGFWPVCRPLHHVS